MPRTETIRCLNCGEELGPGRGIWVVGELVAKGERGWVLLKGDD